jgi:ribosome biogenesis protein Nip4
MERTVTAWDLPLEKTAHPVNESEEAATNKVAAMVNSFIGENGVGITHCFTHSNSVKGNADIGGFLNPA